MTPRPSVLDQQVRSSDHDPGNDREDAGEQHDADNESGHGTHPFTEATLVPAITRFLVGHRNAGVPNFTLQQDVNEDAQRKIGMKRESHMVFSGPS
jgi:hypothetical protein